MSFLIRSSYFLFVVLFLVACAGTGERPADAPRTDEAGSYLYDAWRPENGSQYEAINKLLDEADVLMQKQSYDLAADKLERVLRIKPAYAPAWSRLAWMALQRGQPERAMQMASRSNSLAYNNPQLQALNWSFIRSASEQLGDEKNFNKAEQEIRSLKAF